MCGIIGYVGEKESAGQIVHSGLKKLQYRGYDSCGIAVEDKSCLETEIALTHALGSPDNIDEARLHPSRCAIGHTRWATHGRVNLQNAHPHYSFNHKVYLVHNGVIENYNKLKRFLQEHTDWTFYSDTDSEILANLIAFYLQGCTDPLDALRSALKDVKGTVGIAVLFSGKDGLYGARRGSPLVLGVSNNDYYLSSDTNALPPDVDKVIYLEDGQIVHLNNLGFYLYNVDETISSKYKVEDIKIDEHSSSHEGYLCFMEKEIMQQPQAIRDAMLGRINEDLSSIRFGGINLERDLLKDVKRILFLGCGTAHHAGLVGKYMIENIANIPASAELASEYKYKNNPTEDRTLVIAITQSGETIDTLAALKEAQNKGLDCIAITNVVSSSIARQAGKGIYQHAGAEISVASTKAFTSQVTIVLMLAILLGRRKGLSVLDAKKHIEQLKSLPSLAKECLSPPYLRQIEFAATKYRDKKKFIFLGRQTMYPIALEAALKLKEISYLDAQGYAAGEFKHGPLALVDEDCVCIYFATQDELVEKNISNIQEIKARGGAVIIVKQKKQDFPSELYDCLIEIPNCSSLVQPVLSIIPLQYFSMFVALGLKLDVDKPRNLAKSVTVE